MAKNQDDVQNFGQEETPDIDPQEEALIENEIEELEDEGDNSNDDDDDDNVADD
jgi:hypothetical protein